MKLLALALLAAIGGATFGIVLALLGFARGDGGDEEMRRELDAARSERRALVERVARLERDLAELDRVEPARESVSHSPRLPTFPPLDPATAAASPNGATAALDPRRLLAEYVASFEDGGTGSDFFRMAVAAYAWQLRRELHRIAVDRDAPDALRLQVIAMFDGGSFRGDGETIDALLELLRQGGWEQGAIDAIGILGRIGDRRTAELLEAVASRLEPLRVRAASWAAIAQLCGGDADPVLLRLFERERDPDGRAQLIALFKGADLAATLRAYEIASRMETAVRLEAAGRVGRFRDERFGQLIDEWLSREEDDQVRARLLAAQEQRRQVPRWHELQAVGPPDVPDVARDDVHAWAAANADGGREWLELGYPNALVADRVTIHETCTGGGLIDVAVLEEGGWRSVWSGEDPQAIPGPRTIRFAATRPTRRVRLTFETKRHPGWEEVDAVELAGPGGSAWASEAAASSRYGEPTFGGSEAPAFEQLFRGLNDGDRVKRRN
jgi:hypothetical protein